MPRLPVPDDHASGHISVAGAKDLSPRSADVQTDAVDHARDLSVREDDEGRYIGVSEHYAADVAAYLGVDWTEDDPEAPSNDEDVTEDGSGEEQTAGEDFDAESESVADAIEDGVCPWCDDYEGDGVPQHAGSAHPDEWGEYKGSSD